MIPYFFTVRYLFHRFTENTSDLKIGYVMKRKDTLFLEGVLSL
ncbi:hypothetical protein EV146_11653 [Mesobacillus foraminis]|uniref:Uncharacterized protein n=1 Tax=Mesobacillus foraminis TaxID=279826 RepID=A0A4R2B010_9BACI|nr:hypothetical protein EV146_11653 [Mesobacillus foraminis]